jgi:hypothetical protein
MVLVTETDYEVNRKKLQVLAVFYIKTVYSHNLNSDINILQKAFVVTYF